MIRDATTLPYTEYPVAAGNYDSNRLSVDRIIIHTAVTTNIAAAASRFNTIGEQASAHYMIGLHGEIAHFLEEYLVAYHAGNYPINQRSIGIEHADNGMVNGVYDDRPRPDALYTTSALLVADICKFYNISCDRAHILKHKEVSDRPTACCDALDIDRIVREAGSIINQNPDSILVKKTDFEMLVTKSDKYDKFVAAGYNSVDDVIMKVVTYQKDINDLSHRNMGLSSDLRLTQESLNAQNGQIESLHKEIAILKDQVANLPIGGVCHDKDVKSLVNSGWLTYLRSRKKIQSLVG